MIPARPACSGLTVAMLSLMLTAMAPSLPGAEPARDILGLTLNMTKAEALKRLQEIGMFERNERKQQEIWKVRDPSFSHLIVAFNKEGQMRFITAVAREDKEAKRVSYAEIADLKKARQAGDVVIKNFNYQWDLPVTKETPAAQVIARGRDPKYLSTYSLKRGGNGG